MSQQPEWWSWEQVLYEIPNLGIPHFQRGQVWGTGNRVALLESMYEASPCGSFVLWQPEGLNVWKRTGVSLCNGYDVSENTKWLVDGQQRTRSLLGVFSDMLTAEADPVSPRLLGEGVNSELGRLLSGFKLPDEEKEGNDSVEDESVFKGTWYAVLPTLSSLSEPIFKNWSGNGNILRSSLFRYLHPRTKKGQRSPHPLGMVPLAVLLTKECGPIACSTTREAVLLALTGDRENDKLDELIPWGPQFLKGYTISGDDGQQIGWASIPLDDTDISTLMALLEYKGDELNKFQEMMTEPRFAIGELPRKGLGTAISAYVRINRAGIRVQPEEQALALLTSRDDRILVYLAEFFKERDSANEKVADQRSLLIHGSDKQMGFSLWMSTVTRYTALFMLARSAQYWLGVSAIDRKTFRDILESGPENDLKKLIKEAASKASKALLLVDDILSEELYLDHRMARRDTRSILPLLELLSHLNNQELTALQEGKDTHRELRAALVRLLHLTMLHTYLDNAEMRGVCFAIHGRQEEYTDGEWSVWDISDGESSPDVNSKLGDAMRRYMKELYAIWMRENSRETNDVTYNAQSAPTGVMLLNELKKWAVNQFSHDVDNATNLQSSAVGWLYGIERRGKAKELDWKVQVEAYQRDERGTVGIAKAEMAESTAEPLAAYQDCSELHPEKQHIVPFSKAKKIAGGEGTRSTASTANSIGNLTWISSRQNDFKSGFSDRWTVFDKNEDKENILARGILAKADSGETNALELYLQIQERVRESERTGDDEGLTKIGTLFDNFRHARMEWMKQQMQEWLDESLPGESKRWLVEH
jgi:hypothetical protein